MGEITYVYLMEDIRFGGIKIGISKDPTRRKTQIEHYYQNKVVLRYLVEFERREKARRFEGRMHRHFLNVRTDGEWFALTTQEIIDEFPKLHFIEVEEAHCPGIRNEGSVTESGDVVHAPALPPIEDKIVSTIFECAENIKESTRLVEYAIKVLNHEEIWDEIVDLTRAMDRDDLRLVIFAAFDCAISLKVGDIFYGKSCSYNCRRGLLFRLMEDLWLSILSPQSEETATLEANRIANQVLMSDIKRA